VLVDRDDLLGASMMALAIANWPTGPAPKTAIDSPPVISQNSAPM
jgi:hypothetical protein